MKAERAWFWGQALLRKDAQSIKYIAMLTIVTKPDPEGRAKPESSRFGSLGQSERAFKPYAYRSMTILIFITEKKMLPPDTES
ncbi:MAG: hypothetical protein ACETWK_06770 [Candidatus Aminicenantaceae bacterium]